MRKQGIYCILPSPLSVTAGTVATMTAPKSVPAEGLDWVPWTHTHLCFPGPASLPACPCCSPRHAASLVHICQGTSRPARAICKAWRGSESRAGRVGRGLEKTELVD